MRTTVKCRRTRSVGALTATVTAAGLLLTSCGGDGSPPRPTKGSGKTTLTEMDYYISEPGRSALAKQLTRCGALAGVSIKRQIVPDLRTKVLQLANSRALPDLILLDNPDLQQLAATGALVDLGAAGVKTDGLYPNIVAAGKYRGKTYGVAPGVNQLALYYNTSMLAKAGVKPPATWDELRIAARKLTQDDKVHGIGFAVPATEEGSFQFESFFFSAGASLKKLDSPEAVSALTLLKDLVSSGSAPKDVLSWNQMNVGEQFTNGSLAMMINGPWEIPLLRKAGMKDFGIVPVPAPAGRTSSGALGGEVWAAGSSGAKSRKAAEVIKCLVSKGNSLEWAKLTNYVPSDPKVAAEFSAAVPTMKTFVETIGSAKSRTAEVGRDYPKYSQALWTAVQAALSGSKSPGVALTDAQKQATQ
ncbi:extracellular solute-binding protein [Streptomyces platensis]|uniref:sugar ABC transporter substrate-binding protein n=1 Tax=Streptomyces platensis TaxID=58346 RepID=UPI0022515064|nr:extracellular solute-binding protein [Streptomyces platensis]MCX4637643.1 extracellular solute-binding protein [Streptomyces platensis]